MLPVRCYTCNTCIAHLHAQYEDLVRTGTPARTAMDSVGVHRMCCRRMFLGYVDLMEHRMRYPNVDARMDDAGTVLYRHCHDERTVSCD